MNYKPPQQEGHRQQAVLLRETRSILMMNDLQCH